MNVLAGQSENGWEKSILKGDLISYQTVLTHTSSTTSNQSTGQIPSEIIHHLYKQFSNVHVYVTWGSGTKNTTFNLLLLELAGGSGIIQTREIFSAASRAGDVKGAMVVPRNLYSADGAFVDTTNLLSPYMIFQDLAGSGSGTNTVTINLVFASDVFTGVKQIGDNV